MMRLLVAVFIPLCALSCDTDRDLYRWNDRPLRPDKLAVSGTVCTERPQHKVLFMVDVSDGIYAEGNDPRAELAQGVIDMVERLGVKREMGFALMRFAGVPRTVSGFTKGGHQLISDAASLRVRQPGCREGRCRDLWAALSHAGGILYDELKTAEPGDLPRTAYSVVLLTGGAQIPAIGRCACRDMDTETERWPWNDAYGMSHEWVECSDNVGCPAANVDSRTCPDSFSHWVLPKDAAKELKNANEEFKALPAACRLPNDHPRDPGGPRVGSLCCVAPVGGRPGSCEQQILVGKVRELRAQVLAAGGARFQFHVAHLPDAANYPAKHPFAPLPCLCDGQDCARKAAAARAEHLLRALAKAGGGGYRHLRDHRGALMADLASAVGLFDSSEPVSLKGFLVTNASALPEAGTFVPDSDQDGLADHREDALQTCAQEADSDGDGVSDLLEIRMGSDPLVASVHRLCKDLSFDETDHHDLCTGSTRRQRTYRDRDGDGLNVCEERILGTVDGLFDSDGDSFGDKVEFVAGTNHLASDGEDDLDLDGQLNRDELRLRTDPRANDSQKQLDLSYRYNELDEGLRDHTSASPRKLRNITGVIVLGSSAAAVNGPGTLRFDPGDPKDPKKRPPTLSWRDFGDSAQGGSFGPPVAIARPRKEGYRLPSGQPERFLHVMVYGPAQYPKAPMDEIVSISSEPRRCLRFEVHNITLVETREAHVSDPGGVRRLPAGHNSVLLQFAQSSPGHGLRPAAFRAAMRSVIYRAGPPVLREPAAASQVVEDSRFVRPDN